MPVYNEAATIETIVRRVLARPETGQLVIVNDASTDDTREHLQQFSADPRVKLLNQTGQSGKRGSSDPGGLKKPPGILS